MIVFILFSNMVFLLVNKRLPRISPRCVVNTASSWNLDWLESIVSIVYCCRIVNAHTEFAFYCVPKHTSATQELLIVFGRSDVLFWHVSEILPGEYF